MSTPDPLIPADFARGSAGLASGAIASVRTALHSEPLRWGVALGALLTALLSLALLGVPGAAPGEVGGLASASLGFGDLEQEAPAEGARRDAALNELRALHVAERALHLLQERYVEPEKFKPRLMLEEAVQSVAHLIPEMLVDVPQRDDQGQALILRLRIGSHERKLDLNQTADLYDVGWHLLQAARFVANFLPPEVPAAKVEYTAFNGALSTLDPYSRLLDPEQWRDMQTNTVGNFGGLGIVILPMDGVLTIQSVLPDSPARRAGLASGDQIQQIDGEDTLNMTVDAAVERLRGEVGTTAKLVVRRKSWDEARSVSVVRAVIHLQSVESKVLDNGVGYARIKSFQRGTAAELGEAIDNLLRAGAHPALVLDLRDNPGGLLDEAIRIGDLFIESGPAVTTVTGGKYRDVRMVTGTGRFVHLPLAVLINGHSASASEVVAGALKYSGRAIVVGEQSFGKGSVQVPYEIAGGAFKMTVAKYLVPGDISIHGKGIEPDIGIQFVSATREQISLFGGPHYSRATRRARAALESQPPPQPKILLKVLLPDASDRDGPDAESPAEVVDREPRRRAAAILRRVGQPSAVATLAAAQADVREMARQDDSELVAHLRRQGVDWRAGPPAASPQLRVEIAGSLRELEVQAGEILRFSVTLTNTGKAPLYRLHVQTHCDDGNFDGHEQLVGRLEPGQGRTVPLSIRVSLRHGDVQLPFAVEAAEDGRALGLSDEARLVVRGRPQPAFAFRLWLDDAQQGPEGKAGDGVLQPGEQANLVLEVRNAGEGLAAATVIKLRSLSGQRLHLVEGRARLGPLAPGAVADARIALRGVDLEARDAKGSVSGDWDPVRLELTIVDESLAVERVQVVEVAWARREVRLAPVSVQQRVASALRADHEAWNLPPIIELAEGATWVAAGTGPSAACTLQLQATVRFDADAPPDRFVTASVDGDKQFYLNADGKAEVLAATTLRLDTGLNAVTILAQAGPRRSAERTVLVHCAQPRARVERGGP